MDSRYDWKRVISNDEMKTNDSKLMEKIIFGIGLWEHPKNHVKETMNDVVLSYLVLGLCQAIFKDALSKKRAPAKIVPKLLNIEQKQRRSGTKKS